MAGVEGLEPPTPGFGDRCSNRIELHSSDRKKVKGHPRPELLYGAPEGSHTSLVPGTLVLSHELCVPIARPSRRGPLPRAHRVEQGEQDEPGNKAAGMGLPGDLLPRAAGVGNAERADEKVQHEPTED